MSKLLAENINRLWSSLIINELIKNNITHFYLSPGMRNAPLVAALCFYQKENANIEIFNCIDERGASFRALGYAKASGKPCALICTSGTALANYFPAVIEASKSNLPLVVLSADRPKEQILSGDNQTINQNKIYGEFVRAELDLGAPALEISPRDLTTNISNLIAKASGNLCGPVHLNCPFREPLENTVLPIPEIYLNEAQTLTNSTLPATEYLNTVRTLAPKELKHLSDELLKTTTGILVIGSLPPSEDLEPVREFIKALNWPVYLDISSSLKYEYSLTENAIPTFDHPEVFNELVSNPPETILHVGGRLTSKHYYSLLRALPACNIISLNNVMDKEDPAHNIKIRISASPNPILTELTTILNANPLPRKNFSLDFRNFVDTKRKIIDDAPLSYPVISKTIIESIKENSNLYIANSTVVRSFDSYCALTGKKKLTIATNRGVSGIEGFIASSCGFLDGTQQDIYLVVGDVSFMHDLNSLYFLKSIKKHVKIILINNFGGGIFTLLPINKEEDVLSQITSPHNENFRTIAENFHLKYLKVNEVSKLSSAIFELQNASSHALLEIFVDHEQNKNVYDLLRTIKLS